LDEAALTCPVPLDSWTSDMGGRGVHIIAAFQSRAQLLARWGATGARVILGNAGAVMLFSQGADTEDLTHWSTLTGQREEAATTTDPYGRVTSRTTRTVPVITPAQLANLPKRRVVVLHSGMPPVLGWARMAWTRRDVRTQTRLARRASAALITAAEQVTHHTATHTHSPLEAAPLNRARKTTNPRFHRMTSLRIGSAVMGHGEHTPRERFTTRQHDTGCTLDLHGERIGDDPTRDPARRAYELITSATRTGSPVEGPVRGTVRARFRSSVPGPGGSPEGQRITRRASAGEPARSTRVRQAPAGVLSGSRPGWSGQNSRRPTDPPAGPLRHAASPNHRA
jgi:hypothetical protein